jgi:hypothetical protein
MFGRNLRYAFFLLIWAGAGLALAQEPSRTDGRPSVPSRVEEPEARILVPISPLVDLEREPRTFELRNGLVIGAFHLYPTWEPGPYGGPPARIWRPGSWGVTLWRDPVTGWPLL